MPDETRLALALGAAAGLAYLLTPLAIRAAGRLEFYDQPASHKGHAQATPYLGGAAVIGAIIVTLLLVAGDAARTLPVVGGAVILWAVGTTDDRRHLSPALRAGVEVLVALGLHLAGLGWDLGPAALDATVTALWVLGVINAFNLFDNMDGASSTMAAVCGGSVAVVGVTQQDPWLAAGGAALAGACFGFLPHNLAQPRARIFLGDGGSMPLGFLVAALVMVGASTVASGWESVALALLLVAVPATDTALVVVSRRRKGISVLTGGRDHLTHRARRRLGTARAVAITLATLQAVLAAVALLAAGAGATAVAVTVLAVVVLGAAVIAVLESEEDRLIASGEVSVPKAAVDAAQRQRERRPAPLSLGDAVLVVLCLGAALSPLAFGFYASTWWAPIGIGLAVVAGAGVIRRPQRLPWQAWAALAGLAAIGVLSLLSSRWALATDQAITSGNRWLVLAATLALALVLVRSRRRDVVAIGSLAAGTLVIAGIVLVRMLGDSGPGLFLVGRLHEPLGYINAQATVFIMGAWLFLAAAEQKRSWLAGPGLAAATLLGGLALLSQSRGAVLAALASVAIVLIAVPGRRRRIAALAVLAASLVVAAGPLTDIYEASSLTGAPPSAVVRDAAITLLGVALGAGAVWAAIVAGWELLADRPRRAAQQAATWGCVAAGVLVLIAGVANAGRASTSLQTHWDQFTAVSSTEASTSPAADSSRLASGAGNRYEYWRVAADAFAAERLHGVGAGNFDRVWYAERRISEDVRQPHSIELQVVSELGLLGGAALLLLLAGVGAAVATVHRTVRAGDPAVGVAVAAVGVPVVWLVHTSVDWQHLLPGTSAVALIALAVLLRQTQRVDGAAAHDPRAAGGAGDSGVTSGEPGAAADTTEAADSGRPGSSSRAAGLVGAGVAALLVAVVGASLARQAAADHYRDDAYAALQTSPAAALAAADRAIAINPQAPRNYFAKSAALARLGEGAAAAAVLRQAADADPTNPVTWALLGDVASRLGQTGKAQRYYARALALSPRDPGLQALAK